MEWPSIIDRHEASRALFAPAELLVYCCSKESHTHTCQCFKNNHSSLWRMGKFDPFHLNSLTYRHQTLYT